MSLPESAKIVLRNNIKFCFKEDFDISYENVLWFKENLNLVSEDSAFIDFYTIVAFPPIGNGEELYNLEGIIEAVESGFHEEEYRGIYERYLPISSIEGEGSYFYDIKTDKVYDVNWGEEAAMMDGSLTKCWPSFYAFIEWYYQPRDTNA